MRVTGVEQRQQIRMLEIRGDFDLGQKAICSENGTQFRIQNLERDLTIMPEIARKIDGWPSRRRRSGAQPRTGCSGHRSVAHERLLI